MKYRAPRFLFRRHEILRRLHAGTSFVEIGAANLALTEELLTRFDRGLAIDFTNDLQTSYSMLDPDQQSKLKISNVDFMKESIGGEFDCVVACEIMEHVENDGEFLRRIHAMLRPGGQLLVSVPARRKSTGPYTTSWLATCGATKKCSSNPWRLMPDLTISS